VIPAPGREKIGETRESVLSALPFLFFCQKTLPSVSRTRCSASWRCAAELEPMNSRRS